jgi:hypothetical protein
MSASPAASEPSDPAVPIKEETPLVKLNPREPGRPEADANSRRNVANVSPGIAPRRMQTPSISSAPRISRYIPLTISSVIFLASPSSIMVLSR